MFSSFLRRLHVIRGNVKFLLSLAKPHPILNEFSRYPGARDKSTGSSLLPPISCIPISTTQNHSTSDSPGADSSPTLAYDSSNELEPYQPSRSLRRMKHRSVRTHSIRMNLSTKNHGRGSPCANRSSRDESGRQTLLFQGLPLTQPLSCASRQRDLNGLLEHTIDHTSSIPFAALASEHSPQVIKHPLRSKLNCLSPKYLDLAATEDLPIASNSDDILSMLHPSTPASATRMETSRSPGLSVPSVFLTCPTPNMPSSPVFVPRTPVTVSGYVSASSVSTSPIAPVTRSWPVPSLPKCEACGLSAFETREQCPECDNQWLACKIWYRANDRGRRQHLTEPYIRPGESTAQNRALLDFLGVPGGHTESVGLGFQVTPEEPSCMSRWHRFLHYFPGGDKVMKGTGLGQTKGCDDNESSAPSFLARSLTATISALKHVWKIDRNQPVSD